MVYWRQTLRKFKADSTKKPALNASGPDSAARSQQYIRLPVEAKYPLSFDLVAGTVLRGLHA
jgi:hypothetical protein